MRIFIMKWIIILLLIAAGAWIYFNVDLNKVNDTVNQEATNALKQEKTIKVFFDADQQNKDQTQQTIKENF